MDDWVRQVIEALGLWGIALLMFLENLFPPIPSELVMPLAGFFAADGETSILGVIIAGTAGAVAGAIFWYAVARRLGERRLRHFAERHGRWITLSPDEIGRLQNWFRRHQAWAVPLGHLVPGLRTFVSIPAGLFHMGLPRFLLLTTLGAGVWTALLALAGYMLGRNFGEVERWLGPVSIAVIAGILIFYLYRIATFRKRQ